MPVVKPIIIPIEGEDKDFIQSVDRVNNKINQLEGIIKSNNKMLAQQVDRVAGAKQSWTEFRSAYSTVLDVARAGQQVWNATGQAYANYAGQVALVARTAGTSAEEASRLIQVADDMGVTYEELSTMMRKMTMEGVTPSIEAMGRLSDEYLAIQDPAEKAKFLLDNFGRAGAEMGRLMSVGSAGMQEMNAAIDKNLILTEEGLKNAEEYRMSVDELSDSWEGFKISVGGEVLPWVVSMLQKANLEVEEAGGLVGYLKEQWVLLLGPLGAAIKLWDILSNKKPAVPTAPAPPRAPTAPRTPAAPRAPTPSWQNGTQRPFTPIAGTRDSGGAGIAGTPYMIGTGAQPEMFVPNTNGTFVPNANKLGNTYNITVNNPKKETAENSIRSALKNMSYLGAAA